MGVSKTRGTPKWMVKIRENPIGIDDLGGKPTIFGNTHLWSIYLHLVDFYGKRSSNKKHNPPMDP